MIRCNSTCETAMSSASPQVHHRAGSCVETNLGWVHFSIPPHHVVHNHVERDRRRRVSLVELQSALPNDRKTRWPFWWWGLCSHWWRWRPGSCRSAGRRVPAALHRHPRRGTDSIRAVDGGGGVEERSMQLQIIITPSFRDPRCKSCTPNNKDNVQRNQDIPYSNPQ